MINLLIIIGLTVGCQTLKTYDEKYFIMSGYMNSTYKINYSMNSLGSRQEAKANVLRKAYDICGKFKLDSLYTQVELSNPNHNYKKAIISRYSVIITITCLQDDDKLVY